MWKVGGPSIFWGAGPPSGCAHAVWHSDGWKVYQTVIVCLSVGPWGVVYIPTSWLTIRQTLQIRPRHNVSINIYCSFFVLLLCQFFHMLISCCTNSSVTLCVRRVWKQVPLFFCFVSVKYKLISVKIRRHVQEWTLNKIMYKVPTSTKICASTTLGKFEAAD